MSFIQWLILGLVFYASGFGLRHYHFKDKALTKNTIISLSAITFLLSVVVFVALNFLALKKPLDLAFVGVSSLVSTFIFYYGLSTDTSNNMNIPD